jgi:hypothetical protein
VLSRTPLIIRTVDQKGARTARCTAGFPLRMAILHLPFQTAASFFCLLSYTRG